MEEFKPSKIPEDFENEDEKMKIFSTWSKYLYFSQTLNFADFKYDLRFFISCFDQKLQPSYVGLKWAKTDKMDPLCRAVTFD